MPCMTWAELDESAVVSPADVIRSLMGHVQDERAISANAYDYAIQRAEPPFRSGQLEAVIRLCVDGITTQHVPRAPVVHSSAGRERVGTTSYQREYAALLGASSTRLAILKAES